MCKKSWGDHISRNWRWYCIAGKGRMTSDKVVQLFITTNGFCTFCPARFLHCHLSATWKPLKYSIIRQLDGESKLWCYNCTTHVTDVFCLNKILGLRMRSFTSNRLPVKNFLIDSLLISVVESICHRWQLQNLPATYLQILQSFAQKRIMCFSSFPAIRSELTWCSQGAYLLVSQLGKAGFCREWRRDHRKRFGLGGSCSWSCF